ncbi:MAG TPA: ATP-binding protein [Usitatibacter sp.]|nr:ATP-binding protein [Usitatibacter sp.]
MDRSHPEPLRDVRGPALAWRRLAADAALVAGFMAGYLVLDWVSYIHPLQEFGITPWNPQPALAIALLMVRGQAWIPVVFAATLAAEWLVRGAPAPWPSTLLIAIVLALGYAAIARALTGRFAVSGALETRRDAVRLVGVVAVGTFATGVLYLAALLSAHIGPLEQPFSALVRFWIGDAVGVLVTLPFVLMLSVPRRRREFAAMLASREAIAHVGAAALAFFLVFSAPPAEAVKYFYVLFLPLIFIATRLGLAGSTLAALGIQAAVILSGELAHYQALTVFELQALLIALTVTGLFLGITVDERRRAEEELRRGMRLAAAGEMAAALAHELNQPLTAVATYARAGQMIAARPEADAALLSETLRKLVDESTRAAEVVRRLRDFFRTGATRLAPVPLAGLVQRALSSVRPAAESAGVVVESHVDDTAWLLADEVQLEVVLRNLLSNAIQATAGSDRAREVRIHASIEGGAAVIVVEDSGPGVAEADAERIFAPFETSRASGMGMGLAISRAIVEAHGGSLRAEPRPRGRFRLQIALAEHSHG